MHYFGTSHEKKINFALKEWHTSDPVNRIIPNKKSAVSSNCIDEMQSKIKADPNFTYDCAICKVQCQNKERLTEHLQGSKHKKKLASLNNTQFVSQFHCEICNASCNGLEPFELHLATKKHKKKVSAMAL